MEREKLDKDENRQVFFFNNEGKLVIQTNNGVIDDGVEKVRLKGFFSCNAKTMGIILSQINKIPVALKKEYSGYFPMYDTIINPSDIQKELVQEIEEARKEATKKAEIVAKYAEEKMAVANKMDEISAKIKEYNELPWWKRMFKMVEI